MTRDEQIEKEARRASHCSDEFTSFILGAEWADKTIIEKACKWLQEKNRMCMFEIEMILGKDYIEDFKKAMEE